ncbi:MAG: transposase [Deltaproteobacteria bacterium]|nr:transposase [Deltaproteobacteria bacterium]
MPRGPRILPPNGTFHLIVRSNNGLPLYKFPRDFLALKQRLGEYCGDAAIKIYHYCLMRTHFHLLAYVPDTKQLPGMMKALQLAYFHYFRRLYGYRGHLFHGRYRCIAVTKEIHFLQCGRYIELNAVHAGLKKDPAHYPWSSFHFYAANTPDALVTTNPIVTADSGGVICPGPPYAEFVREGIDMDYQRAKKMFEEKGLQ